MPFIYAPMAKMLKLAGADLGHPDPFTYNDYLYELLADGSRTKPITEQQWEMICDIQGQRRLVYSSTVKHALANLEHKASDK